ncbi:hypothetical protein BGZ54_003980, partial [Gamsiella multidivaricata]
EQGNLESFAALLQHGGRVRLINGYGPTETTTFATTYEATAGAIERLEKLPIGRPIGNTQVYVLDKHGQPVPLGVVGELHIGGAGVANGYLNRPELTAERFLPNPFSQYAGARMYRTGDLVRYLPDGDLIFMGRIDDQIKIRGFRIEPGEIEARLMEHELVYEATVIVLGDGSDKRLVAYVVSEPKDDLVHTLRSHVAARLPEYMMPTAIVRLDALPLTNNGKIDRRALPNPDEDTLARGVYEAPQGETEVTIASIWSELLGVNRISRHDSFFAMGGHSLLVVKMLERLHRISWTVSIRTLFESPTLSILAQALYKHQAVSVPPNLITPQTIALTPEMLPLIDLTQEDIDRIVSRVPGGITNIQDIYTLSPLQDGILFHHLLASEGDPYLLTSYMAFEDRALLDRYLEAFQKVVNRHDILRTAAFWQSASTPAQIVYRHAPLVVLEQGLDPANGAIRDQLSQLFNRNKYRMDLNQAPLLRFASAQDTDGRWLLAQLIHHFICDHESVGMMNVEIEMILAGKEYLLTEPKPFRSLVAQMRLGPSQDAQEAFFKEMLHDIEEPTLPFGLIETHSDGANTKEAHRVMPRGLNDRLRLQAKRTGVSLAALCHAAWALVLARTSGQDRVVFGTVLVGGMQDAQGDNHALGLSINTLPVRCDLGRHSVQKVVQQSHSRLAALVEHENASLALAQQCSGVPAGSPLFNALLNYRHTIQAASDRNGVATAEFVSKEERVNFEGIEFLGGQERTNYPIAFSVEDFGSDLGLTAQCVHPIDPVKLCGYMQQALQSLADALERTPDLSIDELEVLPTEERNMLLQSWNKTDLSYPESLCVHQLFECWVEHSPDAVAIVCEGREMTYGQLNACANVLARQLIELGANHGDLIATLLKRSFELVVAQIAILKVGAVYVPIDLRAPVERQSWILTDSAARLLITDEQTAVPAAITTPLF